MDNDNNKPLEEEVEEKTQEATEEKKQETSEEKKQEQPDKKEKKPDYKKQAKKMSELELAKVFQTAEKAGQYLEVLQRSRADYENYQKRIERDRENFHKYANQSLLQKLLGVQDILDRAISSTTEETVDANFHQGICLVQKEFLKVLNDSGVKPIEAVGKHFDPMYHEAIQMQSLADKDDMVVLFEVDKGYMFHDRLLKASKVIVNKKPVEKKPEPKKEEQKEQELIEVKEPEKEEQEVKEPTKAEQEIKEPTKTEEQEKDLSE